jgi:hypothetical protein
MNKLAQTNDEEAEEYLTLVLQDARERLIDELKVAMSKEKDAGKALESAINSRKYIEGKLLAVESFLREEDE